MGRALEKSVVAPDYRIIRVAPMAGALGAEIQKLEPADIPYTFEIVKEPEDARNFGGAWHSDSSYQKQPPLATLCPTA